MESGVWAQGGSTCRVQVRPSASLLACPASTVSALSHCPASASLEGLAQACPSAPMIPACPCWSTDRADAYPVPCDLVSAFHLLPVAPASWLCLPAATLKAGGLSAFLSSSFFLVENQKATAETAARSQQHSTFHHFLLFTAICIRVVRKTPIPEGR